jgi:hypothetical protein
MTAEELLGAVTGQVKNTANMRNFWQSSPRAKHEHKRYNT